MASTYPFPDNVHVTSSVTLKRTDTNYLLWKTQFESLLSSQKLIGFINGAVPAPAQTHRVVNGDVAEEVPVPAAAHINLCAHGSSACCQKKS